MYGESVYTWFTNNQIKPTISVKTPSLRQPDCHDQNGSVAKNQPLNWNLNKTAANTCKEYQYRDD